MKIIEFSKVADVLAREHKIRIKEGDGWAANIKSRTVFYVKKDIYDLPEEHILGLLLHEIAHIHYTTDVEPAKQNKELTFSTINALEDISIEHIISKDYPNAGDILDQTRDEVLDKLVQILPKLKNTSLHEKALLYACAKFHGRGFPNPLLEYEKVGEEINKLMTNDKQKILNRKETKEHNPLAKKIVTMLLNKFGEPTDREKANMLQEDNATGEPSSKESARRQIIDGLKGSTGWKGTDMGENNAYLVDSIVEQGEQVGRKLRTILKRNNAMEFGGRYRTGKLKAKRFVKIFTTNDRHPFYRRIVKSNQSYAFAVTSDISGSMSNRSNIEKSNLSAAQSSLLMVSKALNKAGITHSINVFGGSAVNIKPMNKLITRWEEINNGEKIAIADNGNTNIDRALKINREQLNTIRAENKISVVLTDGSSQPGPIHKEFEKCSKENIETIFIAIGGSSFYLEQAVPKKNIRVLEEEGPNKIGEEFLKILKETVKNYDK